MNQLVLILGDQLSEQISSLKRCHKLEDTVLICELNQEATYVKHHQKKIAFLFSAMRHFAQNLSEQCYQVRYTKFDDPGNTHSFTGEVNRFIKKNKINKILVTEPGEYRVLTEILSWEDKFGLAVDLLEDDRFLCSREEFTKWAEQKNNLRMENFYREMRKKFSVLVEKDKPVGGKWNYDSENRKFPTSISKIPSNLKFEKDQITNEVINLVKESFQSHLGNLENFDFAVTREQAKLVLAHFIDNKLKNFGDYQDAMIENQPFLYHSCLSFYLNCGLLLPLECIKAAEEAYFEKKASLNSVEGFIRQILGWREYMRGIYWLKMPSYSQENFFKASRNLPDFYWSGKTKMNCLNKCISETIENSYAHHIQRLMVLGNFCLIAGIDPAQVNEWFLIVYADAYEWVELPNVSGMSLFADGGYLASKPYAAGGSYINKMSNYCKRCFYQISKKTGAQACPFNYLYWDFLERNRPKLEKNPRIGMMYKTYDRMEAEKKKNISEDSRKFLELMEENKVI